MKHFSMLSMIALVLTGWITSYGQTRDAEVPGDHFSLEGALELFKKSESPEAFERLLNSPDSKVNNLDLNGDGYIDYVRVFDRQEGNVHVFILQAVVSDSESQDIAVIELEKLANGKAVLQIIGDEDIYGVETIIEPTREVRTYAGTMASNTVVNVWSWPVVHYVYSPHYVVWHSPWGWHHRAVWWRPWRPVVYVHYYNYWRPYRPYYSLCHTHRVVYAHTIYRPHRSTSVIVHNRHHEQVSKYRSTRGSDRNGRSATADNDRTRSSRGSNMEGRQNLTGTTTSSSSREVTTLPTRIQSRERTTTTDLQRNPIDRTSSGRIRQVDNVRTEESGATRPSVRINRTETSNMQRNVTRERSEPRKQISAPARQQQNVPQRRTENVSTPRQIRSTSSLPERSISSPKRSESPQRSINVRTESSGNSGSPQRSNRGGAPSRDLKRGRQ